MAQKLHQLIFEQETLGSFSNVRKTFCYPRRG